MKKITCSYGTTFNIFMTEENLKPIMVVDCNVKNYTIHLGDNHGNYPFPRTVVINDKLYLDKELTNQLLCVLDQFIETTYITSSEATKTNRGFKILEPKDIYGNTISLQESSNVEPAIWFGVNMPNDSVMYWKNNELIPFKYPSSDILLHDRLHLKMPQAKKLKKIIKDLWKDI